MNINLTPIFYFFARYSRKTRLKFLFYLLTGIILCFALCFFLGFLFGFDSFFDFLIAHPQLLQISVNFVFCGILLIPISLLALIPKQQVRKSKEAPDIGKVVSTIKKEYKKLQLDAHKNSRPATLKERLFWGSILLLAAGGCFCIGGIATLGGIFWLGMAIVCFCSSNSFKIMDKKGESNSYQSEHKKGIGGGIFTGIVFIIAGVLVAEILTVGRFTCSRGVIRECEIQKQHLWELDYKVESKLALEDLHGAFVESETSHHHDEGDSIVYYVVLRTDSGNRRLFDSSSSFRSIHEKRASQINQFLNSNQENLEIKETKLFLLVPLLFLVFGGFILWSELTFLSKKSNVKSSTLKKRTKRTTKMNKQTKTERNKNDSTHFLYY